MNPTVKDDIRLKYGSGPAYDTPNPVEPAAMPGMRFYTSLIFGPLRSLWLKASKGLCDDTVWSNHSVWFAEIMEKTGCRIHIEGLDNIDAAQGPCVFIANHMSTLETFVLPGIICPLRRVTFVVKRSLVEMPFFGPIMRSRNPVVVNRTNPREDLATVLKDGVERLQNGMSVIVFPQSTRTGNFSREHFNSIGVKLARKANAPVVPIALKTDAWGNGQKIKELGKIRPDLPIRFKFGKPVQVEGNGRETHEQICDFIASAVDSWQLQDGINA